jgi:excisionase family DNA binding protein
MQKHAPISPPRRTKPLPAPLTYTLIDAAEISGLSKSTLYRHAKDGKLQLVKVGGRTLVNAASLHTLLSV